MNDSLKGTVICDDAVDGNGDVKEEHIRLTREALADVGASRIIDHQAVKVWACSLSTDTPLPVPP
ncbi:hypothetical protein PSE10C_46420 [Pseudomonas amygdali pv. eriobotryae]|uniref:Uncharacterized protein n=1 Tax=Pseudomonas amygdali pv. eriobotryae TaxID=129137 RepID=A0A9P3EEP5_PSEA0|nr:hypothetical protein PSE10A_52470 [Pseudomonas amygdali pv. eriobotryae]GFZ73900.1 hypothetical protein PSE10C_46420 [Pseudomonas amygdali pv. eriobotryae]